MSTRKYKPYPTRKQQQSRRMRTIALVLIVLIVVIVILNKSYNTKSSPAVSSAEPEKVSLESIQPAPPEKSVSSSTSSSAPEPIRVLNPGVAPKPVRSEPASEPKPSVVPVQPVPEPAAVSAPVYVAAAEPKINTAAQPAPSLTQTVTETDADDSTSTEAKELIDQALKLRDEGKVIPARELLNNALDMPLSPAIRSAVKFQLSKLADLWLFTRDVLPQDTLTSYYLVQPGDLLQNIANKKKVPYELLMQINGIDRPELLQAGKSIKVVEGPFNVVVYKGSFTMDLYLQRKYVKTYRVGLGTAEHETPSGRWRVQKDGKLVKPTWTDPDTGKTYVGDSPDYPLGSRWIAIEGIDDATRDRTGFAIHGTKDPDSIGTRSSRGCIRLFNGDVIEVYNLLYGGISEVLVMD